MGHEWAVQLLQSAIKHQRIGHAYLITGPDRIGKTTLARTLAQALNCPEPQAPCGSCRSCRLIANDRHMDIRLIEPEVSGRGKLTIKIETIRRLQQDLMLTAYEARYKVAIIKRFDAATDGAANAFLKTLEEPPQRVIIILTANDADTLLPTISSRCRTINLRPQPAEVIAQSLTTRWHVPEEKAELLAHLADGRLGWAVWAAQDGQLLAERETQLAQLYAVLEGRRVTRFQIAHQLSRRPEGLPNLLRTWLSWWRDMVYLTNQTDPQTAPVLITNLDENGRLRTLACLWTEKQAASGLKQTRLALWQLQRNANTRLVLENLLLTYPLPSE